MAKDYKSTTSVTVRDFKILMERLQDKYNQDWNALIQDVYNKPPKYNSRYESVYFFGNKDNERTEEDIKAKPSLNYFMLKNKAVNEHIKFRDKGSWSPSHLYKKYRQALKMSDDEKLQFQEPYNHAFFEYIDFGSYEEFRASLSKEIVTSIEKKDDWREFYISMLWWSEQRVVHRKILLNFEKEKVIVFNEQGKKYGVGTVVYKPTFLEIRLDRASDDKRMWKPFTAYFEWNRKLEDIAGMVGVYSGVSKNTNRAIGEVCILVESNKFESNRQDIEQFLFLEVNALDIATPAYDKVEGDGFLPIQESRKILQKFVGDTELYIIRTGGIGKISRYIMKIEPELYGLLESPYDDNKYLLRMRASSNVVFFNVFHVDDFDRVKYATHTSILAVDRRSISEIDDGTKLYQAAATGMNKDKNWIAFPVLLVISPPSIQDVAFLKKRDIDEFLKMEGREKLNKEIIKTLYEMEVSRLKKVEALLGDTLSNL